MLKALLLSLACCFTVPIAGAAQECPALGSVPDSTWREHTLRAAGIRLQLPGSYREKIYEVRIGDQLDYTFQAGVFRRVHVSLMDGPADLDSAKPRSQERVNEFKECVGAIGARAMILQTMRGLGTIFRNGKQTPSYDIVAMVQVSPGQYLWIQGNAENQEGQDEIVAAARTIEFLRE